MPIIPDSNLATLANIKTKVRRLTRSASLQQLSETDLENYINQFLIYDFPEHLRLWSQKTTFTFWCAPNIEMYQTTTTNPNDVFYNWDNIDITTETPVYVAGYKVNVYQDRDQFYNNWPRITQIQQVAIGDGGTTTFTGTITGLPILQNYVMFYSIDVNNNQIVLTDIPISSQLGNLVNPNDPTIRGSINYLTGAFVIGNTPAPGNPGFTIAPAAGQAINCQFSYYQPSRPLSILFFDDYIVLRPIPDQSYQVEMEVYQRPDFFQPENNTQLPKLAQWWEYISFGASLKILQDRLDMDTVNLIMPEFLKQQRLVLRQTLQQLSKQRSRSIYQGMNDGFGNSGWNWWSQGY